MKLSTIEQAQAELREIEEREANPVYGEDCWSDSGIAGDGTEFTWVELRQRIRVRLKNWCERRGECLDDATQEGLCLLDQYMAETEMELVDCLRAAAKDVRQNHRYVDSDDLDLNDDEDAQHTWFVDGEQIDLPNGGVSLPADWYLGHGADGCGQDTLQKSQHAPCGRPVTDSGIDEVQRMRDFLRFWDQWGRYLDQFENC